MQALKLCCPPRPFTSLQVAREGTKKTVFTNFMELCKSMNRNHEHVQAYLLAELGTSGEGREGQQLVTVWVWCTVLRDVSCMGASGAQGGVG